ncbi:FMN phosphatase YigB (HAD superfamily) [Paenibacillus favisporus]|uniref:FMN phosphatase YigB (HAD superfamily) n=1 Tax=Paenibacillus favisporus TaxID=221028 RepID=A0ABV2FCA0_9BACL
MIFFDLDETLFDFKTAEYLPWFARLRRKRSVVNSQPCKDKSVGPSRHAPLNLSGS